MNTTYKIINTTTNGIVYNEIKDMKRANHLLKFHRLTVEKSERKNYTISPTE